MKIQNYKIDQFCTNLMPEIPAILIYGQDYGLISERSNSIINSFFQNTNNNNLPYNIIDFECNNIISKPEILKTEAQSISLLNNKKIIRIKDANDSLDNVMEEYLLTPPHSCLLLLLSENLSPRSKIRKFFELHKYAVIIPCYSDEKKNILTIIETMLKKEKIDIDSNGKQLLANYLGIDRLVTKMEIEKAIIYAGKDKILTHEDISSFLSDQTAISIDELYDLSLLGDIKNAYRVLNRIQNEGITAIQILRSFIRQLQYLYSIKNNISINKNINHVIDNFKPPIYFKRKNNFKSHAEKWSCTKIQKALKILESAEISCKQPKSNQDIIAKHTILSIGLINKI